MINVTYEPGNGNFIICIVWIGSRKDFRLQNSDECSFEESLATPFYL